jgi:hypothetical protein
MAPIELRCGNCAPCRNPRGKVPPAARRNPPFSLPRKSMQKLVLFGMERDRRIQMVVLAPCVAVAVLCVAADVNVGTVVLTFEANKLELLGTLLPAVMVVTSPTLFLRAAPCFVSSVIFDQERIVISAGQTP